MYSRGPRTDPWGRPLGAGTQEDLDSPWTTHMERSLRKEASHERRVPETPKDKCRRCNKLSWSTGSNAALTSKRAKSVTWQRSTAPRRSESRRRRRVIVMMMWMHLQNQVCEQRSVPCVRTQSRHLLPSRLISRNLRHRKRIPTTICYLFSYH